MAADGTPGACVATDRTIVEISRTEIHKHPTNPRQLPTEPAALADAVADITITIEVEDGEPVNGRGITSALLVRRRPLGGFELIDGERRLVAAELTGLRRLLCEIVVMSDDAVLEAQLRSHGVELSPLEEAAALARFRSEFKATPAEIANRTGKSVRLVHQRLALHDSLGADGKALLAGGRISIGLALQLATLAPAAQLSAAREIGQRHGDGAEPIAAREAEWIIRQKRLRLVDGGFPLGDAQLVAAAGACTVCPKRSGAQAALFADGLADGDLCGDEACFTSKRKARVVQVEAKAKADKIPFVSGKAAEKYFPKHQGGRLPYNAGVVDLDAPCDVARPPAPAIDASARRGGPVKCRMNGDGAHEFNPSELTDEADSTLDEADRHEAEKLGVKRWMPCVLCEEAWVEMPEAAAGKPLVKWVRPTWREHLGDQLPKISAVVVDAEDKPHELVEKKVVAGALRAAGRVDEAKAFEGNEFRESPPDPPKKPGLDKYEVDRLAKGAARGDALGEIAKTAARRKPDLKFWRFLGAMFVRSQAELADELEEVAERRGLLTVPDAAAKGKGKAAEPPEADAALLAYIAEEKSEDAIRALIVELVAAIQVYRVKDDDRPLDVACRFYGVDLAELTKAAAKKVKIDHAAKVKAQAAKKPKAKPAKKSAAAAMGEDMHAEDEDADDLEAARGTSDAHAAGPATPGTCAVCGCQDDSPCEGGCAWADTEETTCTRCSELLEHVLGSIETSKAGVSAERLCDELDEAFAEEEWYDGADRRDKTLEVLAARGRIVLLGQKYCLAPPTPTEELCPLTWPMVQALAKRAKFTPHEGAQSPANVWGMVQKLRAYFKTDPSLATRTALRSMWPSAGTGSVDLALLYLVDAKDLVSESGGKAFRARVEPAPRQTEIPGSGPAAPAVDATLERNILAACATPRTDAQAHKACKPFTREQFDAAVLVLLAAKRLERKAGKLTTAKVT